MELYNIENLYFIIIVLLLIGIIYWIHNTYTKSEEKFDSDSNILTLNPYERCQTLGVKKFTVRDLRTKLWLTSGLEEGFNRFLPGRFGISLMMSEKPDEYLPLRTVSDPNDYLIATYNGDGIRTVSNPTSKFFIIQVFIYNGFNILGYISESDTMHYLYINDDGTISNTTDPKKASIIEIISL